ncbi:hypothetical protein PLICRDRAFT_173100 [Plicaturopsis crispa FD-325 SS-3]|nr:hypothetical protein PLICRDRAFT_173100 [Plicaturopsis crispa FD-325 SS-3]
MQHPTLQDVRIRSTRDAHRVFYAVARQVVPLITRRLDAEERRAIKPGNIYVWEERGAVPQVATGLGMERWTDGMGWGPSRVREEFLFYHQKELEYTEASNNASTPWAQMISLYPIARPRATSDAERLIKQTYSVNVSLPADRAEKITRKWHITAYFSQQTLDGLRPIDQIPGVGDVPLPEGWFKSARATKKRSATTSSSPVSSRKKRASTEAVVVPVDAPLASTSSFSANPPPAYYHRARNSPPLYEEPSYSYPSPDHNRAHNMPYDDTPSTSSSSSGNATPSPAASTSRLGEALVPLKYLMDHSYPRRDPIDEQLLSRFSRRMSASPTYGYSP